ncbi:acyl dehydratase [Paraburkholderia sediminicola]|uniref:acyl dehydratase n=1 Tax=Paraburkholderia sediminicola TaxID=458836 RepID=UPI0038BA2DED
MNSSAFLAETRIEPRYFDDVRIADRLPELTKGPLTTTHLMRWSSAIENWHKIHYDRTFTQEHDRLPDLLVNGSLKQNFLVQIVKEWATHHGWPWKVNFQFRAMDVVGSTLVVWGEVTGLLKLERYGLVEVKLGIRNQDGQESTPGSATIALPYRGGPAVPYPFVAPSNEEITAARTVEETQATG